MSDTRPSRRFWLRLLTVLVPLLLVWGIPEIILRCINPPLQPYRAIFFGNDPNSPLLFMQDPALFWKLRPGVNLPFKGVQVRTNADGFRGRELKPGQRTVLCLGDSTPFGWSVEEPEAYPAVLEGLLNATAGSSSPWQVVNAGVPAYSSYQMRLAAPALLRRWKPEVLILCVGNNDSWPAEQSDKAIGESHRGSVRFQRLMSHSRFALWLRDKVNPQTPKPFIAESLQNASPRVSTAEFNDHVREIIRLARESRARVILLDPPVNLYKPPFVTRKLPDLDAWADWCREVHRLAVAGRTDEAVAAAESKLKDDPRNVYALWLKGFAITASGRIDEGRDLLEQSLEVHPFPEGCRRSYRDFIARTAAEEKCDYVAVNAMFLALERKKGPMGRLYLDPCHPTPEGHALIAFILRDLLQPGDTVKE